MRTLCFSLMPVVVSAFVSVLSCLALSYLVILNCLAMSPPTCLVVPCFVLPYLVLSLSCLILFWFSCHDFIFVCFPCPCCLLVLSFLVLSFWSHRCLVSLSLSFPCRVIILRRVVHLCLFLRLLLSAPVEDSTRRDKARQRKAIKTMTKQD